MNQPEPSQPASSRRIVAFHVGDKNGFCVSNNDADNPSPPVDEDADLLTDLVREFRQVARDLLRHDSFGSDLSAVDAL